MMGPSLPVRISDAAQRGYFVVSGHDSDHRQRNAWWARCRRGDVPYVWLKQGNKWDQVEMDLLDYRHVAHLDAVNALLNEADARIQAAMPLPKRQKRWIHGIIGSVVVTLKVPHPHGAGVASDLSNFVQHSKLVRADSPTKAPA